MSPESTSRLPSHRALAFGDTVLDVDGDLRVWDEPLDSEANPRQAWNSGFGG